MKLVGVELVRLAVPFRSDVATAVGVHRSRSLLFVRVVADQALNIHVLKEVNSKKW